MEINIFRKCTKLTMPYLHQKFHRTGNISKFLEQAVCLFQLKYLLADILD